MKLKINASVTDFPLYVSLESFFKHFKEAGADGVEVVGGYKNRWSFNKLFAYSAKYNLPIVSFHQPIWSGVGVFLDKGFFRAIANRGVKKVTFHPLTFTSMDSRLMKAYFRKLATIQQSYGVQMCIENMPNEPEYRKLYTGQQKQASHLAAIRRVGQEYGFLYTFDVSHAELVDPQKNEEFKKMFPGIGVIQLSNFTKGHHHLPLTEGNLHVKNFITYLVEKKYKGELTLEINHSMFRRILYPYDFSAIRSSIQLVRELAGK